MKAVGMWRRSSQGLLILFLSLAACTENIPYGGKFTPPPAPGDLSVGERMLWPVGGAIVAGFRSASRPNHQGVDIAAPPGSLVVAAQSGRVSFVGRIPGYGNVVTMEHERQLATVYAGLGDDVQVVEGARLSAGEVIARTGPEGYLHYEIRKEKEAIDPAQYYQRPPAAASEASPVVATEPHEQVPLAGLAGATEEASPSPPSERLEVTDLPPIAAKAPPPPAAPEEPPLAAEPLEEPSTPPAPAVSPEPPGIEERPVEERPAPVARATPPRRPRPPRSEGILGEGEDRGRANDGIDGSLIAGIAISNVFWVPAKLAYAGAGGIVGTLAFVLTGGAVTEVWDEAFGGDYYVTASHLRGDVPLRFRPDR